MSYINNTAGVVEVDSANLSIRDVTQYIANLEFYIGRTKELHWSAVDDKTHILCDELKDKLSEYQDELMEMWLGMTGEQVSIGFLNQACEYGFRDLPALLRGLWKDTCDMLPILESEHAYCGLKSKFESMVGYLQTMLYKEKQK